MKLKLEIELVPSPLWEKSLYRLLPRSAWRSIRKETLRRQGDKCGICGSTGKLQLHELWEYDDVRHIQRLKGFLLLCDKCHAIKHFGRTYTRFGKDEVLMEALDEHYCRVNGCKSGDLKRHYRVAFRNGMKGPSMSGPRISVSGHLLNDRTSKAEACPDPTTIRGKQTFMIDQGILEKTLEFAPGEWLLSSYIATGIENVPIIIQADNAENELEKFLSQTLS